MGNFIRMCLLCHRISANSEEFTTHMLYSHDVIFPIKDKQYKTLCSNNQ